MKNFLYLCFVLLSTNLNAQWETLTPDATANAGVILRNESTSNSKLIIGVSSCSGCFTPNATANDAVYSLGGSNVGNLIFNIPMDYSYRTGKIVFSNNYSPDIMVLTPDGKVRIGNISTPGNYNLYVQNGILTERLKVAIATSSDWADYVFNKTYNLPSLLYVEKFIKTFKHLPGLPSAEAIVTNGGIDIAEMMSKQMAKIEEITLYLIELKKENENLKKQINSLNSK